MSKIVEVYPDIEEVKLQVEARKAFGWEAEVGVSDRGVYEVTFTRDDTKAKNKKLGELEADFDDCFAASDYIERYSNRTADKKKFRAFRPWLLVFLIYLIIQFGALGLISFGISGAYKMDPTILNDAGINFTAGGVSQEISSDWSTELNLEEIGLKPVFEMFGYTEPVFTVTADDVMDLLFIFGVFGTALLLCVVGFIVFRIVKARTYFRAEKEYIANRQAMLRDRYDELEARMDEIMEKVARVKA